LRGLIPIHPALRHYNAPDCAAIEGVYRKEISRMRYLVHSQFSLLRSW
jgi:hypothetical protein